MDLQILLIKEEHVSKDTSDQEYIVTTKATYFIENATCGKVITNAMFANNLLIN